MPLHGCRRNGDALADRLGSSVLGSD